MSTDMDQAADLKTGNYCVSEHTERIMDRTLHRVCAELCLTIIDTAYQFFNCRQRSPVGLRKLQAKRNATKGYSTASGRTSLPPTVCYITRRQASIRSFLSSRTHLKIFPGCRYSASPLAQTRWACRSVCLGGVYVQIQSRLKGVVLFFVSADGTLLASKTRRATYAELGPVRQRVYSQLADFFHAGFVESCTVFPSWCLGENHLQSRCCFPRVGGFTSGWACGGGCDDACLRVSEGRRFF